MVRPKPISNPPFAGAVPVITQKGKSRAFKTGYNTYKNDQVIVDGLNDIITHLTFNIPLPPYYEDKMSTNKADRKVGWRNCKPAGQNIIFKYRIDGTKLILGDLGTHKKVLGPTRKSK